MPDQARPPDRAELLHALRAAERLLRVMGSDWQGIRGYFRKPMLRMADRLARLLKRANHPLQ